MKKNHEGQRWYEQAEKLLRNKKFSEAIPYFKVSLRKSLSGNDVTLVKKIHFGLGKCYFNLDEYELARIQFRFALSLIELNPDSSTFGLTLQAGVLLNMGLVLEAQDQLQQAHDHFLLCQQLCAQHKTRIPNSLLYNSANFLGQILLFQGGFVQAEPYLKLALTGFEQIGNEVNLASCHRSLGVCLNALKRYSEAEFYLEKACDELSRYPDCETYLGDAQQQLGLCYLRQQKYQEGLPFLSAARNFYECNDNEVEKISTTVGLWIVHYQLRQYKQAGDYARQVLQFYQGLEKMLEVLKANRVLKNWINEEKFDALEINTTALLVEIKKKEDLILCTMQQCLPPKRPHPSIFFQNITEEEFLANKKSKKDLSSAEEGAVFEIKEYDSFLLKK